MVRVISTKMLILWYCHFPNHRFYRTATDERNALRGTVEQRPSKELVGGTKCCKDFTLELGEVGGSVGEVMIVLFCRVLVFSLPEETWETE